MAPDRHHDLSPDEEPTNRAHLRIKLERAHLDEDFKRRRVPGWMRLIAAFAGLTRQTPRKPRP
jgi:hypothetical protein